MARACRPARATRVNWPAWPGGHRAGGAGRTAGMLWGGAGAGLRGRATAVSPPAEA
jgi:hypothetical protein